MNPFSELLNLDITVVMYQTNTYSYAKLFAAYFQQKKKKGFIRIKYLLS